MQAENPGVEDQDVEMPVSIFDEFEGGVYGGVRVYIELQRGDGPEDSRGGLQVAGG